MARFVAKVLRFFYITVCSNNALVNKSQLNTENVHYRARKSTCKAEVFVYSSMGWMNILNMLRFKLQ